MLDYIIVGSGLAGIAFAETALENDKSIFVFDNDSQNSSKVAAGLYNPVILKRFSKIANAQEQLDFANAFYHKTEKKLSIKIDNKLSIYRKLASVEEQNNWFFASDKVGLSNFLSPQLIYKTFNGIDSPYGYGEVLQTGYVDTALLLKEYKDYLNQSGLMTNEYFDYSQISFEADFVVYKNLKTKHIVFAEGFGLAQNPFFYQLPLDGTKGELLIIKAPNLNLDVIINASVYILPLGNQIFKVGATYEWDDKTQDPTEKGKQELVEKIKEIINCDFEIIEHLAGVRPTVKDRKSLVGTHSIYSNIHILNGLGTRGVMLAPYLSKALFDAVEYGIPLDTAFDIKRFEKK